MDETSVAIRPTQVCPSEGLDCHSPMVQSDSTSSVTVTESSDSGNETTCQIGDSDVKSSIPPDNDDIASLPSTSRENSLGDIGDVNKHMSTLAIQSDDSVALVKTVSTESNQSINKGPEEYKLKWITWHDHKIPIITQNQNGPCPLIAIGNILLLRGKMKLPSNASSINAEQLLHHVANNIMESRPEESTEEILRNFEQNMQDAISLLPQLHSGLDVNIKFTGVNQFEFTQACTVFDLLDISLYHGWVVDPQASDVVEAVGNMGYNQLVEMIIQGKTADDSSKITKALQAQQFLENSASQLTYHGLCELNHVMADNELAVLFRNNHFSTILKRRVPSSVRDPKHNLDQMLNELFLLVTDQGYIDEFSVVWEMLCNIEGDSVFVDSSFKTVPPKSTSDFSPAPNTMSQIDQDYMVALALQEDLQRLDDSWEDVKKLHPDEDLSDEELARLLHQKEVEGVAEEERASKQHAEQMQAPPSTKSGQTSKACSCTSPECSHHTSVCNVEPCPPNTSGSPSSSSHKKNACSVL